MGRFVMCNRRVGVRSTLIFAWCLLAPLTAAIEGADQTEYLRKTPSVLEEAPKLIDAADQANV
jgi:hypothetical protein